MIIHLKNEYEAGRLPLQEFQRAYLVTFDADDGTVVVTKFRNAPSRLLRVLKHGGGTKISREDYYELRDFIFNMYYHELNNDCGFVNPPLHFGLDSKPKESMDDYTKKLEMKIWKKTYEYYNSSDCLWQIPIAKVFENCDRAVREFRKSIGV